MDTDSLFTMAAYALQERRAHEDPWHELANGALTPEQVTTMRRDLEPPEQLELGVVMFGPTSPERVDQTLSVLLERYLPEGEDEGDGKVVSLGEARSRRWWSNTAVSAAIAVAAAVLLVVMLRPSSSPDTLPGFDLRFEDGWSGEMRGADDGPDPDSCDERYQKDRMLSVRLAPAEAFAEETSVAVLARSEDGTARWLPIAPHEGSGGVVVIEQPVSELGLEPGIWTLTFFVTRRGQQHDLDALVRLAPGEHPGVTVTRGTICVVE